MMRNSTLKDVAAAAGASAATASYVLSNSPKAISPETRERVLRAARDLGYQPNLAARTLAARHSRTVALWIANTHAPFFAQVIRHFQQQARQGGYEVVIREMAGDPDRAGHGSGLSGWPVDGVIAFQGAAYVHAFLRANPLSSLPFVSIGAYHEDCSDFVAIDLQAGATEAVRHLLGSGRRRVAFLVPAGAAGEARRDAYRAVMAEAGLEPETILAPTKQRADVRQALREFVGRHGCPEAIFCYNDDMALGAYRGLCDLGLRVPKQVALVGCDGIEDTEYLERPLSTIVQPVEEMCRTGWRFLENRMRDPMLPPQRTTVTPRLAVRASSEYFADAS